MAGHKCYLKQLRREYKYPDAFGSMAVVIQEIDEDTNGVTDDFFEQLGAMIEFAEDNEASISDRFVYLAILGIDPDYIDWSDLPDLDPL